MGFYALLGIDLNTFSRLLYKLLTRSENWSSIMYVNGLVALLAYKLLALRSEPSLWFLHSRRNLRLIMCIYDVVWKHCDV